MEMFRRTFAEINLENLSYNFHEIKKVAGDDRFLCPMVKANAYGHGDIQIAQHLEQEGVKHLGVCLIEEGLLLKSQNIRSEILVFRGFDKQGAQKIFDAQLTPVISTWEQINLLEAVADEPIKVHIKFNTGMNRLGFLPEDSEKLRDYFRKSKRLKLKAILSHFYCGEDAQSKNGHSAKQTLLLQNIFNFFKDGQIFVHLLNSGGIAALADQNVKTDTNHFLNQEMWGFRPGLILYGYNSSPGFNFLNLKPVMTLKSVVNNIRKISKDQIVSYGATWAATSDAVIAVVPIGYADGVHRLISNKAKVLFAGQLVPVIGQVCMDFLMLDITEVVKNKSVDKLIDEEVILFGYDNYGNFLSAEKNAEQAQTITWEVLTSVGERVPRHFKGSLL